MSGNEGAIFDGFAEYIQAIIAITKIGKNYQYYIGDKIHISKV